MSIDACVYPSQYAYVPMHLRQHHARPCHDLGSQASDSTSSSDLRVSVRAQGPIAARYGPGSFFWGMGMTHQSNGFQTWYPRAQTGKRLQMENHLLKCWWDDHAPIYGVFIPIWSGDGTMMTMVDHWNMARQKMDIGTNNMCFMCSRYEHSRFTFIFFTEFRYFSRFHVQFGVWTPLWSRASYSTGAPCLYNPGQTHKWIDQDLYNKLTGMTWLELDISDDTFVSYNFKI